MIVWCGKGLAIPLGLGLGAVVVWFRFDDPTLGNRGYLGWSLLVAAAIALIPVLLTLAKGQWTKHTFMWVPAIVWLPLLGGLGGWLVATYDPRMDRPGAQRIVGTWAFDHCINPCGPRLTESLTGMRLEIAPGTVTIGKQRRTYKVIVDRGGVLRWRYDDDGSEESMRLTRPDEFIGEIADPPNKPHGAVFRRTTP